MKHMKLGMETISSSMLGHLAVVMFTRTPVSKTEKGRVISTLSTTTFEIRVPNPGCFAMDFPLDESKAYISHLYVESTEDLEVPLLLEPPLMHHECQHVTSFSLDKRMQKGGSSSCSGAKM